MTNMTDSNNSPYFLGNNSAGTANATGDGTAFIIPINTLLQGSGLNTSTNIYTPQISGKFFSGIKIYLSNLSTTHTKAILSLVTTSKTYVLDEGNPGTNRTQAFTFILRGDLTQINFSQGDNAYFTVSIFNGTKTVSIQSQAAYSIRES